MRNKRVKSGHLVLIVLVFGSFLMTSCLGPSTKSPGRSADKVSTTNNRTSTTSAGYDSSFIEVQRNGKSTIIDFDKDEIRTFDEEIRAGDSTIAGERVNEKLLEAGVKCCEPRKRLDACVWQCCDKSYIKIPDCNIQLRLALEKTWGQ